MTREEQIAIGSCAYGSRGSSIDFTVGAKWADEHPKSPWISVKDKLPTEEKDGLSIKVLVVSTKGKIDFSRYDYDMEGWISPVLDIEFTHWMHIPEPTKK